MMNRKELWLDRDILMELLDNIRNQKTISENLLHVFIHNAMEVVNERDVNQIAEEYSEFSKYVTAFWHRNSFSQIRNKELVFQMGQIVACVRLLDDFQKKQKESNNLEMIKNQWKNYYFFLNSIESHSGIKHKELANQLDMSPSHLSHFVEKNRYLGYFSDTIVGREKYYYLTSKGESVLKQLEECKQNEESRQTTKQDGPSGGHLDVASQEKQRMEVSTIDVADLLENMRKINECMGAFAEMCSSKLLMQLPYLTKYISDSNKNDVLEHLPILDIPVGYSEIDSGDDNWPKIKIMSGVYENKNEICVVE